MASTHIRVSRRAWKALNKLKEPGDDFDDVVKRLTNNVVEDPGLYLVNSTGETVPVLTESGEGDEIVLHETMQRYGYKIEEIEE